MRELSRNGSIHGSDGKLVRRVSCYRHRSAVPVDYPAFWSEPLNGCDNNTDRRIDRDIDHTDGGQFQHRSDCAVEYAKPIRSDPLSVAVCLDDLDASCSS